MTGNGMCALLPSVAADTLCRSLADTTQTVSVSWDASLLTTSAALSPAVLAAAAVHAVTATLSLC